MMLAHFANFRNIDNTKNYQNKFTSIVIFFFRFNNIIQRSRKLANYRNPISIESLINLRKILSFLKQNYGFLLFGDDTFCFMKKKKNIDEYIHNKDDKAYNAITTEYQH